MKGKLNVITCASMNCEDCVEFPNGGCWSSDDESQTVILDSEKYILHTPEGEGADGMLGPPSIGSGWESVFLGSKSMILSCIKNLVGLVRAGPYYLAFLDNHLEEGHVCIPIPRVRSSLEFSLLEELALEAKDRTGEYPSYRESIDEQMNRVMQGVMGRIRSSIPELSWAKATLISEILGHQATSLGLLIPFLLMERTEEIFLDRPESVVYFDHQEYGRCLTTVVIDRKNASELTTLLRAETNLHLDRSNPSLKADIRINGIPLRVSASIGPLSPDGFHLEIRRARLKPFTLQDLIDNGTITGEAAAILLLAVASRFNITITGGPGTGKTTLLNALDMTTPAWWRKVYIEDASESRLINGHHQVRLNVDPVDERLRGSTKNEEIIKSLHRSPDYLILGEIQTMEHSEALFQAIAAGLRVMQTCHSDSAAGLISRWGVAHHIESSSIGQMDLIVTLERPRPGESKRVVSEIVEVCRGHSDGLVKFTGLSQIYSVNGGLTTEWSSEGSFLSMADKLGLSTHMPALEGLITLIDSSSNLDIGTIPSLLWTAKHPIAYSA